MRVLGITPAHDSSVAIINDGQLEYFCKEERLSRIKRDSEPHTVLSYILKHIKDSIDIVVISSVTHFNPWNNFLEEELKKNFKCKIVRMCHQHHLAHASMTFNNSGFDSALVCVIDRMGSDVNRWMREAESIFKVDKEHNFKPIYKSFWLYRMGEEFDEGNYKEALSIKQTFPECEVVANSTLGITKVYETATVMIGEDSLENGKTMGLSAYGTDQPFKNLFTGEVPNTHLFAHLFEDHLRPLLKDHFSCKLKPKTIVPEKGYEPYADYAYQVQKQTQEAVLSLVKRKIKETGIKNVCVTGGYALNVVTNAFLMKHLPEINFFFEPLADDSGISIGAALYVYRQETQDKKSYPLKHTFFNHVKPSIPITGIEVSAKQIARLLADQKIVAMFNGQAEAGPRALGHRSILFDARNPDAKQIINEVKQREWYRPFAASVLKHQAKVYFEMGAISESPFMTLSIPVKPNRQKLVPGIVHVDGSCRLQTVDTDIPHFHELLSEFEIITGTPLLLNTSFNITGEPLVNSMKEALDTFKKTPMDVLWFPEKRRMLIK